MNLFFISVFIFASPSILSMENSVTSPITKDQFFKNLYSSYVKRQDRIKQGGSLDRDCFDEDKKIFDCVEEKSKVVNLLFNFIVYNNYVDIKGQIFDKSGDSDLIKKFLERLDEIEAAHPKFNKEYSLLNRFLFEIRSSFLDNFKSLSDPSYFKAKECEFFESFLENPSKFISKETQVRHGIDDLIKTTLEVKQNIIKTRKSYKSLEENESGAFQKPRSFWKKYYFPTLPLAGIGLLFAGVHYSSSIRSYFGTIFIPGCQRFFSRGLSNVSSLFTAFSRNPA